MRGFLPAVRGKTVCAIIETKSLFHSTSRRDGFAFVIPYAKLAQSYVSGSLSNRILFNNIFC